MTVLYFTSANCGPCRRLGPVMEELSQEFTAIFFEGNEGKVHDVVLEMIKSLDKAQKMVKNAYGLVLDKEKAEKSHLQ